MSNELVVFDISIPKQSLQVATILQDFVKDKNLTANIEGKQYPLVEAWAFAGSQLGLYPTLIEIKDLSTDSEIKYLAIVEVRRHSDERVMGRGVAICSNKEYAKKGFEEYAILSMAQTRATGKAFRNLLSWLMKAAGFEATPAEEMDFKRDDIADVPTEGERQDLRNLVYNSTLIEEHQQLALERIELLTNYQDYHKLQMKLENNQKPIDQIINPSQKDINKHLKKVVNG